MDIDLVNNTKTSTIFLSQTITWCLLMPLIHVLSLISNILCIIVFCSKTFIHKPIAIYFICLLISDSTTLLIGYSEMLDRESSMINKSSFLCLFNEKIIHSLTEFIYTFMGKFCLEWILFKVLWTRASTILLAILSIQRSRTFFSLSYHETRFCAICACILSIFIALLITCLEWIGIQCSKSTDSYVYIEIFQLILNKNSSREFYSNYLYENYNESIEKYYCILQTFDIKQINNTISLTNQFNCSMTKISSEFYSLTQSLLSNRHIYISETTNHILTNIYEHNYNEMHTYFLTKHLQQAKSPDILLKLFEKRSCQITLKYSICLKLFNFLHSLSFEFNRHTLAIFFGNALPSFIVLLANLLSIKVIYFSKSLKYLKKTKRKTHHKYHLKNDLRAFLVILIESFSIITISWGIPIFLTMYHCQTLYVMSISSCPKIKKSLAFFLFTDLFNSSTNCLLYSLSGKLFRRKFISIIKIIFTCGKNILWNVKKNSLLLSTQPIELQPSNELSTNYNYCTHSRTGSYRHSQPCSTIQIKKLQNLSTNKKFSDDDQSLSIVKLSDEQNGNHDIDLEFIKNIRLTDNIQKQTFKTYLIKKLQLFNSKKTNKQRRQKKLKLNQPFSSLSVRENNENSSPKQQLNNQLIKRENLIGNVTSL